MSKHKATGHFSRLRLRNWKNFLEVAIELPLRVFLVGPNASGKSNLLDVFRFLRDLAEPGGGLQHAIKRRGGVSAIRCLAARRSPDIEIAVQIRTGDQDVWEYELAFYQDKQRRPLVRRECVRRNEQVLLERPTSEDEEDPERLTQTHLEQVTMNQPFRELATFLTTICYLHIVPQIVREPARGAGHHSDPYGGDFLEQIAKVPERTRNARLRRICETLKIAIPQLAEIQLFRDKRGVPHLRGKYEHWRPQGAWQTEEQFSDGTLRLMGLLWAILDGTGPLLLEEPELSLHPEIVRHIPQMIARFQQHTKRQIIISTHSPELLSDEGIGLNEVLLLIPDREGTRVQPTAALQEAQKLLESGVPIGEIALTHTRPQQAVQLSLFADQ